MEQEADQEISREIIAVAKDSQGKHCHGQRERDAEVIPGGHTKPQCPIAVHVTIKAAGHTVL